MIRFDYTPAAIGGQTLTLPYFIILGKLYTLFKAFLNPTSHQRLFIGWGTSITCAHPAYKGCAHNKEMKNMNIAEYNRKIKALERDMERLTAEIETRTDKRTSVWVEKMDTILKGWTE